MKSQKTTENFFLILTHLGSLTPLVLMIFDFFTNNLTANPIQALTLRTGKTALVLLVLSLASRPVCIYFDFKSALKLRKPFGLYAFGYASLHFLIFIWIDLGLNWDFIKDGFLQKPYALVGFAALLILVPLAITSTRGWQRRLGKRWTQLHKLVYLAGGLVIVHYIWVVKSDIREPVAWGIGLAILLLMRTRPIKRAMQKNTQMFTRNLRKRIRTNLKVDNPTFN